MVGRLTWQILVDLCRYWCWRWRGSARGVCSEEKPRKRDSVALLTLSISLCKYDKSAQLQWTFIGLLSLPSNSEILTRHVSHTTYIQFNYHNSSQRSNPHQSHHNSHPSQRPHHNHPHHPLRHRNHHHRCPHYHLCLSRHRSQNHGRRLHRRAGEEAVASARSSNLQR